MPSYWEWQDDSDAWIPYHHKDNKLIEGFFQTGVATMVTTELSFNDGYDTKYFYDFKKKTQKNLDSGRVRKLRRVDEGDDSEETGFAGALETATSFVVGEKKEVKAKAAAVDEEEEEPSKKKAKLDDGSEKDHKKGTTTTTTTTGGGGEDSDADKKATKSVGYKVPDVDDGVVASQVSLGAQSRRNQKYDLGHAVSKDPHGKNCFDRMLSNEKRLCGEFAVFYHSYSFAALLYEVQAAVAAVLFRFKSEYATLPRLLKAPYGEFPDAASIVKFFPKFKGRDHDPRFRAVAISATSSLLAMDSEAPPTSIFLGGYSCADLSFVGVLENLLVSCGVPSKMKKELAEKIIKLSEKHGLDCSQFPIGGAKGKGKGCKSGRAGHMLQIFVKRSLVSEYVYPALPFGVFDNKRKDLTGYLEGKGPISGQVRICTNPSAFMRPGAVRMFVYSADSNFHTNRPSYQKELTELLDPVIGTASVRIKAATGIYDGKLPGWFCATDKEEEDKKKKKAAEEEEDA